MLIDLILIIVFLGINIGLGIFAGKGIRSLNHFSVGDRSFGTFAIFATLAASFIGGGYTIGNAAKVYSMGMVYAFALLGFSLQQILVALFLAPKMGRFNKALSIGDIIEHGYGKQAKVITGVLSLVVCAGILGAQVGALGAIFEEFFALPKYLGIGVGFGVIIFYATLGGMRAVVYTDILQFSVLIIGIPLAFLFTLHSIGGVTPLLHQLPPKHIYFIQSYDDAVFFLTLFVTFIFGETLVPPYVQRLFMAKSTRETKRGTLCAGMLSIPFFIVVGSMGLLALYLNPDLSNNAAFPYIVKHALPGALRGFVIAGILSVIMSSASGFLNAASVAFVNDLVIPLSRKPLSDGALLRLAKLATVSVGLGAIVFACAISNVLDILLYAYNFWSPIVLVPLVAIIRGYDVTPRDFQLSALAGAGMMLLWSGLWKEPYHLNGVVIGVAASFLVFVVSYQVRHIGRAVTPFMAR